MPQPIVTESIRDSLTAALERLQQQRETLSTDIETVRRSEELLRETLSNLADMDLNTPAPRPRELHVSPERLERIRAYIMQVRTSRQVDIAKATGENTGTVSVALRVLEREGVVTRGDLDSGSRVWHTSAD